MGSWLWREYSGAFLFSDSSCFQRNAFEICTFVSAAKRKPLDIQASLEEMNSEFQSHNQKTLVMCFNIKGQGNDGGKMRM